MIKLIRMEKNSKFEKIYTLYKIKFKLTISTEKILSSSQKHLKIRGPKRQNHYD